MTIKYIITQINDNIIYSKYNNNGCLSLNIVDKSSLVGNIYIGRVENVVKNISSAFVEIENKIKCYYQLENNKNNIFLNTKNNKAVPPTLSTHLFSLKAKVITFPLEKR